MWWLKNQPSLFWILDLLFTNSVTLAMMLSISESQFSCVLNGYKCGDHDYDAIIMFKGDNPCKSFRIVPAMSQIVQECYLLQISPH